MIKIFIFFGFLAMIVASTFIVISEDNVYNWGGVGYDSAKFKNHKSSKYSARFTYDLEKEGFNDTVIDIWVDSKKTFPGVGTIKLVPVNGDVIYSTKCFRVMKHITSPWACSFHTSDLKKISKKGRIEIFNKSNKKILSDKIDFDLLKDFVD